MFNLWISCFSDFFSSTLFAVKATRWNWTQFVNYGNIKEGIPQNSESVGIWTVFIERGRSKPNITGSRSSNPIFANLKSSLIFPLRSKAVTAMQFSSIFHSYKNRPQVKERTLKPDNPLHKSVLVSRRCSFIIYKLNWKHAIYLTDLFAYSLKRCIYANIYANIQVNIMFDTFRDLIKAAHEFLNNYVFKSIHKEENIERQSPAVKELYDLVCNDPVIVANRARLRDAMATKQECVIHGDLHASSIFIKGNSAKVFIVIKGYINHY